MNYNEISCQNSAFSKFTQMNQIWTFIPSNLENSRLNDLSKILDSYCTCMKTEYIWSPEQTLKETEMKIV